MGVIDIHLNNEHSVGLGDNLCLLSAMANIPDKVRLYTTNDHNTADRLKDYARILRIPNYQLEIVETGMQGRFNNTGWPLKLFTDYYRPPFVFANGQVLKTKTEEDKKCIALVGFYADKPANDNNEWPWCKHKPIEYWAKIFAWLKSMDYEVITLDRAGFDLEKKIEVLVKHCKAVISYEGGMAHLSHMLSIPCFLIDWTLPSPSTTLNDFHCDFVHMSNSVYIVRDHQELFNWDINYFNNKIDELNSKRTNNRFMNGSHSFKFAVNKLHGDVTVIDSNGNTVLEAPPIFGDSLASEFLAENYFAKWQRAQQQRTRK